MEKKMLDYKIDGEIIKLLVNGNEIYPGMNASELKEIEGFERDENEKYVTYHLMGKIDERLIQIEMDSSKNVDEICSTWVNGKSTERIVVNKTSLFYTVLVDAFEKSFEMDMEVIKTDADKSESSYMQIVASRGSGKEKEWLKYKTNSRDEIEVVCNGYAKDSDGEYPIEKNVSKAFEKDYLDYSVELDEYIHESECFSTEFDLINACDLSDISNPKLANMDDTTMVVKGFHPTQFKMLGFKDTGYLKDGERKFMDACANDILDVFNSVVDPKGFVDYFEARMPRGGFDQSIVSIENVSKLRKKVFDKSLIKLKKAKVNKKTRV